MATHRMFDTGDSGVRLHVAEEGEGPPVVLLHGFPEGWFSWREQMKALAGAGYRAIAPDLRLRQLGPPTWSRALQSVAHRR